MKNTKKFLLALTVIFTLSTSFLCLYYSMDPRLTSEKIQPIIEKESMKNNPLIEPKSSSITMNITKTADILDDVRDVMIVGELAYVVKRSGLRIINVSNPIAPVEVGHLDDSGIPCQVYVSGSYAYVADEDDGLEIIDISDPTSPTQVGSFYNDSLSQGVYISGSYAYIADYGRGLVIVNISNPTLPVQEAQISNGGAAYDVYVLGDYAYMADGTDGLEIIDISDPTDPWLVGQVDDVGSASGVYVLGDYAYVADGTDGLEIFDVSNKWYPWEIAEISYITSYGICGFGPYVYVAYGEYGLGIVDISDPYHPDSVGSFSDGGFAESVYVNGSYAYVADNDDGLEILNCTEIENTITVTSPENSLSWEIESSHYINWESTGYIPKVEIYLYKDGYREETIAYSVSNNGSYYWTISPDLINSTNYQIRIRDSSDISVYNDSDYFEIYSINTITVDIPNNDNSWETEHSYDISWSSTGIISNVKIELYNNDSNILMISPDTPNYLGQYEWAIPADLNSSQNYQIKISEATNYNVYGISEYFEILNRSDNGEGITIPGYNLILLLAAMVGISVILTLKRQKNN